MRVRRDHLSIVLNALFDRGDSRFSIVHPSIELGELATVSLAGHDSSTVRFTTQLQAYQDARDEIINTYPEQVGNDIPRLDQYLKAALASGVIQIKNYDEVKQLLDRYGNPNLMAGHPPVFAGFDTNLLSWRIDRILGLRDLNKGVGYVNGFVLATGVRDELSWDYKCHNTDPFVDAFGEVYSEYWNQPVGDARIGRLGQLAYRSIRDIDQADEIECDRGDENIVAAYDAYNRDRRCQILLFSNDRNFVERARSHTILSQHIAFPDELPRQKTVTWKQIELLIYMYAVIFGVIELPGMSVHSVWRGKDDLDWQYERVKLNCRSPTLKKQIERDLSIVESYDDIT